MIKTLKFKTQSRNSVETSTAMSGTNLPPNSMGRKNKNTRKEI